MEQDIFIKKFHTLLPECQPEAAQPWCDFAVERVDQQQYVHFKAAESQEASIASWLDVLYEGLRQTRETFGPELAAKVASLGLDHCCPTPARCSGRRSACGKEMAHRRSWQRLSPARLTA